MTGQSDHWRQQRRVRDSYMGGEYAPSMYLLVKDHKPLESRGLPKTGPVVARNIGYACGLSEQLSDIVEPAWHANKDIVE